MRLLPLIALVSALAATPAAAASDQAFQLAGESYTSAFEHAGRDNEHLIEFTRPGETVETWRRLFVLHAYPGDAKSPQETARTLAQLATQRDRYADSKVMENAGASEAIVTFLAFAPGDETAEVDCFRYARAADGHGLVAAQFSFRFTLGAADPEEVSTFRIRAVDELLKLDMGRVNALLAPSV